MLLEFNEMEYSKGRYVPVVLVIVLVTWSVFILLGSVNGLAQGNRLAVDQWQANQVILPKEANSNLNISVLDENMKEVISGNKIVPIGQQPLVIRPVDDKKAELTNVSLFGIEKENFLMPKVIERSVFADKSQVIASETLKSQGFKIGDKLTVGKYDEQLGVIDFISKNSYNVVSIIYTSLDTWRSIKYNDNPAMARIVNGFIVRNKDNAEVKTTNKDNQVLSTSDFVRKLPGYNAQSLTLDGMTYFLIVTAVFAIDISIFVMTLQRTAIFGVLKVQGVPTSFLAKTVMLQTTLLAVLGVTIGLALTRVTIFFLSEAIPYAASGPRIVLFNVLLILPALIGGASSIRTIAKIDPLIAIGG